MSAVRVNFQIIIIFKHWLSINYWKIARSKKVSNEKSFVEYEIFIEQQYLSDIFLHHRHPLLEHSNLLLQVLFYFDHVDLQFLELEAVIAARRRGLQHFFIETWWSLKLCQPRQHRFEIDAQCGYIHWEGWLGQCLSLLCLPSLCSLGLVVNVDQLSFLRGSQLLHMGGELDYFGDEHLQSLQNHLRVAGKHCDWRAIVAVETTGHVHLV